MEKIIFKVLFFLFFTTVFGQTSLENLEDIHGIPKFPQPPEVSILGKYGDIPISYYTGIPEIQIPLYTINIRGESIPVYLQYHASGVKVQDLASRVGLGWSISDMGSITKNTIGFPDSNTRPLVDLQTFSPSGIPSSTSSGQIALEAMGYLDLTTPTPPVDMQPDIYNYSFLHESGKFIFDHQGDIFFIPQSDLRFSKNQLKYTFTTTNGTKVSFLPRIFSYPNVLNIAEAFYQDNNNWKIDQITTTYNDTIDFHYAKTINYTTINSKSEWKIIQDPSLGAQSSCQSSTGGDISFVRNIEELLKRIDFPGGYVEYFYSDEIDNEFREDINEDVYIKEIKVRNLGGDLIKHYRFSYDYFNSLKDIYSILPFHLHEHLSQITKRLKLIKLEELVSNQVYEFKYNEQRLLPSRFSNSLDYWGFANGQMNNTLIPTLEYGNKIFIGGNRKVDEDYALLGILNKIIYPTKGYTEFKYELDDYYFEKVENQRVLRQESADTTTGQVNSMGVIQHSFVLTSGIGQSIKFVNSQPYSNDPKSFPTYCIGYLRDANNNMLMYFDRQTLEGDQNLDLPEGQYLLELIPYNNDFGSIEFKWWEDKIVNVSENRKVGGIRIKEIINYDLNGNSYMRKFNYTRPESNQSSGILLEPLPTFYKKEVYPKNVDGNYSYGNSCNMLKLSSESSHTINTNNGKPIGYEYVTEIIEGNNTSYKTQFKFSNIPDIINSDPMSNIQLPSEYRGYLRGNLLEKIEFNKFNNPIRKEEYTYTFDPYFNTQCADYQGYDKISYGIILKRRSIGYGTIGYLNTYGIEYDWGFFNIRSGWNKLSDTKITEYVENGEITSTKQTSYSLTYKHLFPTIQANINSYGNLLQTKYAYAHDLGATCLIEKNMIGIPLKTETYRNGEKLSEQKTEYAQDATTGNLCLPKYIYTKKGDTENPLEKKITYDLYDDRGNLKQYTLENGQPVSIIWGYNQTQPIAKIEGVAYSNLPFSSAAISASNADNDRTTDSSGNEGALRQALKAIQTALPVTAQMTYFTYDPLIGVTSITDPKGDTQYYIYDEFNRLKQVIDKEGNILSENQYHYRGQNLGE